MWVKLHGKISSLALVRNHSIRRKTLNSASKSLLAIEITAVTSSVVKLFLYALQKCIIALKKEEEDLLYII